MLFPVIIHKEKNSDYGIIVPDFPGVFSGGATMAEALENVQEALALRFCDGEACIVPHPSSLEEVISCEDAREGAVMLVDFDPAAFANPDEIYSHVVLPLKLKRRIDSTANSMGLSTPAYIEEAINKYELKQE